MSLINPSPRRHGEIGMARSIEQSPWEAYEALIESITQNADPADGWDSGSDIEAVLYVRHLEGEVERLREALSEAADRIERLNVENDRLRSLSGSHVNRTGRRNNRVQSHDEAAAARMTEAKEERQ